MRAFAWFLGVLVAAGLAAATIAYPVFELTSRIASWPFHRVYGRLAMLAAVAALGCPRGLGPGARLAGARCASCAHRALLGSSGCLDRGDHDARRAAQCDR